MSKWLKFFSPKKTKKDEEINQNLLEQLEVFRENTKSLDYLRKEIEEQNKGKSDIEILESLARAFEQQDKEKKA